MNDLYNLLSEIVSFKEEIEGKIEDYFRDHALKVRLNDVSLKSHLDALGQKLGIKIEIVSAATELNPIDAILDSQIQLLHSAPRQAVVSNADLGTKISELLTRKEIKLEDGEILSYYAGGHGEQTIVIVNAYGQGLTYWTKLIANLLDAYRVIVWVPRGSEDETAAVSRSYPVAEHREDLKRVIANERVGRCEFLGWCTGPKLILDYYSIYPDDVASMMFLGATFKNLPGQAQLDTEFERGLEPLLRMVDARPQLAGRLKESLQLVQLAGKPNNGANDPDSRAELMQMLGAPCRDLKDAVIGPYATDDGVVNYARQIIGFWDHDASKLFENTRVPVLFVTGECDRIASPAMAQAASQLIPGARYVEVKGGSHYIQYEKCSLTVSLIEHFLRSAEKERITVSK